MSSFDGVCQNDSIVGGQLVVRALLPESDAHPLGESLVLAVVWLPPSLPRVLLLCPPVSLTLH